jgi:hypothetical protein
MSTRVPKADWWYSWVCQMCERLRCGTEKWGFPTCKSLNELKLSYLWCSKCTVCSRTHDHRCRRHCLMVRSMITWSNSCHSSIRRALQLSMPWIWERKTRHSSTCTPVRGLDAGRSKLRDMKPCVFRDRYYSTTSTVVCPWTKRAFWTQDTIYSWILLLFSLPCWKVTFFGAASQTLMGLINSRIFLIGFRISCRYCPWCCV